MLKLWATLQLFLISFSLCPSSFQCLLIKFPSILSFATSVRLNIYLNDSRCCINRYILENTTLEAEYEIPLPCKISYTLWIVPMSTKRPCPEPRCPSVTKYIPEPEEAPSCNPIELGLCKDCLEPIRLQPISRLSASVKEQPRNLLFFVFLSIPAVIIAICFVIGSRMRKEKVFDPINLQDAQSIPGSNRLWMAVVEKEEMA